jgi:hypothetical protein
MTEDVVQVLSQLNPIMQQLAGVDLQDFLQGVSRLPGAVADTLDSGIEAPARPSPKRRSGGGRDSGSEPFELGES